MANTALVAVGAILLAAGGAAAGYGVTRKPTGGLSPEASQAMGAAVAQLDGAVNTARESVRTRASTFAGLQPVRAVVLTDKATAKDMLERGELNFDPQPGEVIEVGVTPQGDAPEPLLIQPQGAMHPPHKGAAGSFAEMMGDQLVVFEIADVTPAGMSDGRKGYVAVSRPLDLKPSLDKLSAAGVAGMVQMGGQTRSFGSAVAESTPQEMPLASLPDAKLVVAVPKAAGGKPMPLIAGGGGAALLGLVLLVVGLITKPKNAAATMAAMPQQTGGTGIGNAQTQPQLSGAGYASATPSPVDPSASYVGPNDLGPGAVIGRWEIIRRLGSGGMADVYLARARGEAGFEKTVAVKVMHPHLARNQRAVDHFLDEARLAANVAHPNVIAIQDLGKIGNDYVIVMEYVDGVDLEKLLASAREAQRPVPVDVGLGILCRICDGLTAAHRALAKDGTPMNIIHRDVKSANVLVSKNGGVKVVDFGIAKAAQQGHLTVAGETKGTPSMMAPEQRVGEQVDVRADVYSVAAVGFEILTGHGVNLDLAALAHLGVENWPHLPLPSSLRPDLPPELDTILLKAMSFERDKRPADCAALETALEAVMKKHALTASDKDIARWVQAELSVLIPMAHDSTALSPPV